MNNTCAGPPTRNQVSSASDWFGISRPRSCGILDLRSVVILGKVISVALAIGRDRGSHENTREPRPLAPRLRIATRRENLAMARDAFGPALFDIEAGFRRALSTPLRARR